MKELIQTILERELLKLEALSSAVELPLRAEHVKNLDTLIKAYRSFSDPAKDPQPPAGQPAAAPPSTQELLDDLASDSAQTVQFRRRLE